MTLKEAINLIAFKNFAGPSRGFHPTSVFYQNLLTRIELRDDGKLELAFQQLWERAVAGAVRFAGLRLFPPPAKAYLTNDNGYEVIPPAVVRDGRWVAAGVVSEFEAYNARELVTESVRYYEILVSWDDLWKWFGPMAEDRPSVRRWRAKNDAEKQCNEWIMQLAADGYKPKSRDALRDQALDKFPGLLKEGFRRCWDDAAPDHWRLPGKPPSNSQSGYDAPK